MFKRRKTEQFEKLVEDIEQTMDPNIPEPDWNEFRSAVRNQLLARSVQRQAAVRRWTGWSIRPGMAWALSVLMAVGITTGAFLWRMQPTGGPAARPQADVRVESPEVESEIAAWSQNGLFDELNQLGAAEEEQFRKLLESEKKGMQAR